MCIVYGALIAGGSPLAQGRELKYFQSVPQYKCWVVAPRAGAGIEISTARLTAILARVAPRAGAGIEINSWP